MKHESMPVAAPSGAGAVLYALNLETLAAFYADVFGFAVVERGEGFAVLERGGFELVVQAVPAAIAASIALADPPRRRTQTPLKLVFVVADLDAARAATERRAGTLDPPEREWRFHHWRVVDGHDPEGNVFQLRARVA
jgi:predicted enzyme related to lactoylglutathione lyase